MEGSKITGIRDVDKLILSNMDTRTFLNTYQIKNKYVHSLFDENVFKNRVEKEFPRLVNLKSNRSWKGYYFDLVYWADWLKEKYGFESNDFRAHPKRYFDIVNDYFMKLNRALDRYDTTPDDKIDIMNGMLYSVSERGYTDLIKFAIDKGANNYQGGMDHAAYGGQIETFEYFRNNIPFKYKFNEALDYAKDGLKFSLNYNKEDNAAMIKHIQTLIKNK